MMMHFARVLFASACALAAAGCQTTGGEAYDKLPAVEVTGSERFKTVRIKTRPGVRQSVSISLPREPVAVALYFRGTVGLGSIGGMENDLPRNGVGIAIVDPPSDLPRGFTSGERSGRDHVADVDAVIRYLRQEMRLPVWLVGMSMGTVSVANVALNSTAGVDGVVFLSAVTGTYFGRNAFGERPVLGFALDDLKVPVLAVAHKLDGCASTPAGGAAEIVRRAVHAPAREAKVFDGGYELSSDPCVGNSYHTFAGMRSEVADHIAGFIRRNSRPGR